MYKVADIVTKLQPHQQKALERALKKNLILAHSTGSGKTLTSIAIADALGMPATVLTPASLVENYKKEIAKHKKGGPKIDVLSLPTAVSRNYKIPKGNTLIIDEAHSLRNQGTQRQQYIKDQLNNVGRVFALTGTPAYNDIGDWAPLVNLVAKENVVPNDKTLFNDRYIGQKTIYPSFIDKILYKAKPGVVNYLKDPARLRKDIAPHVDIFDTDIEKPERIDETIHTPMSDKQESLYRYVAGKMPNSLLFKLRHNLPPSKQEAASLNSFLSGVRQISNSTEGFDVNGEPGIKLKTAADNLVKYLQKNKNARALVYSNYLESGIDSYARILDKEGIKYNKFNGSMTPKQKKQVVDDYNSGRVPVILGSGSASEGLDLKGTRMIQLLEPHFNDAKLDQVIGRGIRYKSHEHLPKEDRNVTVQRYLSKLKEHRNWLFQKKQDTSVDEYLTARAAEKTKLINDIKQALLSK